MYFSLAIFNSIFLWVIARVRVSSQHVNCRAIGYIAIISSLTLSLHLHLRLHFPISMRFVSVRLFSAVCTSIILFHSLQFVDKCPRLLALYTYCIACSACVRCDAMLTITIDQKYREVLRPPVADFFFLLSILFVEKDKHFIFIRFNYM